MSLLAELSMSDENNIQKIVNFINKDRIEAIVQNNSLDTICDYFIKMWDNISFKLKITKANISLTIGITRTYFFKNQDKWKNYPKIVKFNSNLVEKFLANQKNLENWQQEAIIYEFQKANIKAAIIYSLLLLKENNKC